MTLSRFIITGAVTVPTYFVFRWLAHARGDEAFVFFFGWMAGTLTMVVLNVLIKDEAA